MHIEVGTQNVNGRVTALGSAGPSFVNLSDQRPEPEYCVPYRVFEPPVQVFTHALVGSVEN